MGHSKKEALAQLKKERREAKAAKKRKENNRPDRVRFLIVCEGSKTEPNYFEALIEDNGSSICEVDIEGKGMATVRLVEEAEAIKKKLEHQNDTKFDRVWVVFDKDDFTDFNQAIDLAKQKGFLTAWSNEAFELWYYLHFAYLDTAISRDDYIAKLQDFIRKKLNDNTFVYKKRDPDIYYLLKEHGSEANAKKYAARLRTLHNGTDYATHKPCTYIDLLVQELRHPEKVLEQMLEQLNAQQP